MLKQLALILMLLVLAGFMPAWGVTRATASRIGRSSGCSGSPVASGGAPGARSRAGGCQGAAGFDRYGYLGVFLTILVEGVGIPAPGQTFLSPQP